MTPALTGSDWGLLIGGVSIYAVFIYAYFDVQRSIDRMEKRIDETMLLRMNYLEHRINYLQDRPINCSIERH